MRGAIFALIFVAGLASQALAQDGTDDWDLTTRPEQNLTIATVAYASGNAIGVRCISGQLQVLITGLPPTEASFRPIAIQLSSIDQEIQPWKVRSDHTTVQNNEPARFARLLRDSSHLEVGLFADADSEGEGEQQRSFRFDLPAAHTAIDTVLADCGAATSEPTDALIRVSGKGVTWTATPRVTFPRPALDRHIEHGTVSVRCLLVKSGNPESCALESETPEGAGFGLEALRAAHAARLTVPPVEPGEARVIVFNLAFQLE